jgi:hypothetical protein
MLQDEIELKPIVEIECELSYFTILEGGSCDFNWKLESNGSNGLVFKIDFENSVNISANPDPEYVIIKFWGAPLIKSTEGE